ncbi:SusC/RagA family TonB-linked outer membrane protein [Mucilaginibacter hurinus]|uniref:SusC/RagA family TonB-linked outer membrane protein n=1 Tax=Mucilaginibacter hurinus TaxID=2201324 RepID=A0A367GR38_9SPHI|nr:TonB-dependent receptor [Mucilaginibacter hurinus]RCH55720.1 SusC/RagA family TonB-linked outer membrane protein [Mucilaginibacter hurinus]
MKKLLLVSLCILMLCVTQTFAQNRTITGTVTAKEDGLPIPGVSVTVPGTTIGSQTNGDGKFSINVPQNATSLQFSFIGYGTVTSPIGANGVVNATLSSDMRDLAEVVVTANQIRREKRSLGYAATTVQGEDLVKGGNPSALNSLVGRIPGANITTTSNAPGASTRVVFRGGSSINGNNNALIVVDGIPIDNSSVVGGASSLTSIDFGNRGNDIDPDDIENVTALIGPAAAALYGSRASNGALQITTKSGQKGKAQVSFSTSNIFSSILKLPDLQNEYGQGYYTATDDDGNITEYYNDPVENWSWGAPFTGEMQEWGQSIGGVRQMKPYSAQPDNVRNFFKLNNKYNGYGFTQGDVPNKYGYYGSYSLNPYFVLKNFSNNNNVERITGNVNLTYKPASWLNITERIGIDTYSDRRRLIVPKYNYTPADDAGNYALAQTSNGSYQIDQLGVTELVHDLMVTGTHKFNEDFQGSLMLGNNIRQRSTNTNRTATNASTGLVVPGWYNLQNSNGPINIVQDFISRRRLFALYADLNLSYKNMLFLEATARNDWSSTLPINNNSFFYPSVSTSFVFSEVLKPNDWFSYGKIRGSIAQVGQDTDPYQLLTTFSRGTVLANFGSTTFPFGSVAALMASTTLGNPNLKPEQTTSYEIGTEMAFFNNRLNLDLTFYKNISKNQILPIPTPNSTGYSFSVVNAGRVDNKGLQLALRGTVVKTKDFNWDLYGNFTRNISKVVELMPGVDQFVIGGFNGMSIVAAVGKPLGEFYAVTNATDDQGRTIVDSGSGLPVATSEAQYLGSYQPKYIAALGTTVNYKGFTFDVMFDIKQGNKFYSRTKDIMAFVGTSAETGGPRFGQPFPNSVYLDDDGNSVVNSGANAVNYLKQDYFPDLNPGVNIVDGSYVKVRTASLSYQFKKSQFKGLPFNALTVGVFGNNLFIWTAKENKYVDPEINSAGATNEQGFDFTAMPSIRNYGFNVKVNF